MIRMPRATLTTVLALLALAVPAHSQEVAESRSLNVNGISLAYRTVGSGEPLLLLHYFGGCGDVWQPFVDRLARDYRLIIPDLRGHGRSTDGSRTFTHRQAADDILELLDSLGVDRVRAIGMSSGGMTLLHMATRQPDRLQAMILVGATSYFPEPARRIMADSHPDHLPATELAQWAECSSRGDDQTREILLQFHGMKDSYDDMNFTGPYLGTITARTLIVHGDRDVFFPVGIAVGMYESIPESALWIVPNGSHIPIFGAHATAFVEEAVSFLGK